MKKFLLVFLTISIIVTASIIPASANASISALNTVMLTADESSEVPEITNVWTDTDTYPYAIIVKPSSTSYDLYLLGNAPYPILVNWEVDKIGINSNFQKYSLTNGTWVFVEQLDASINFYPSEIAWTSHDIVIKELNEVAIAHDPDFFPPPLAIKILMLTGETLSLEAPRLAGVMKILTLCGVGCLTLLVVLSLFGKRSLLYRG